MIYNNKYTLCKAVILYDLRQILGPMRVLYARCCVQNARERVLLMNPQKNLQFSALLDFYSQVLTDKQREAVDLYYNEDLSLAEIAEHTKITRQGVRDSIKRGEQTLLEMEEKFGLAAKSAKYYQIIEDVGTLCADILRECAPLGNPRCIYKRAEYLVKLAQENKDLF